MIPADADRKPLYLPLTEIKTPAQRTKPLRRLMVMTNG